MEQTDVKGAGPTVPDPGETLWFGVSSTHTPQGNVLQTYSPVSIEARHFCVWRDWEDKTHIVSALTLKDSELKEAKTGSGGGVQPFN